MMSSIDPIAARRSANGSFDPVGFWSMRRKHEIVSSLSARLTATRDRRGRHLVALPDRLVMIADGVGDGLRLALASAR